MLLPLHIVIALFSLGFSLYLYLFPSSPKIKVSGALIAATIASGTVLTLQTHAHILSVCLTGLLYSGVTLGALIAASRKLARQHIINRQD